jgi:hypothetical protein
MRAGRRAGYLPACKGSVDFWLPGHALARNWRQTALACHSHVYEGGTWPREATRCVRAFPAKGLPASQPDAQFRRHGHTPAHALSGFCRGPPFEFDAPRLGGRVGFGSLRLLAHRLDRLHDGEDPVGYLRASTATAARPASCRATPTSTRHSPVRRIVRQDPHAPQRRGRLLEGEQARRIDLAFPLDRRLRGRNHLTVHGLRRGCKQRSRSTTHQHRGDGHPPPLPARTARLPAPVAQLGGRAVLVIPASVFPPSPSSCPHAPASPAHRRAPEGGGPTRTSHRGPSGPCTAPALWPVELLQARGRPVFPTSDRQAGGGRV